MLHGTYIIVVVQILNFVLHGWEFPWTANATNCTSTWHFEAEVCFRYWNVNIMILLSETFRGILWAKKLKNEKRKRKRIREKSFFVFWCFWDPIHFNLYLKMARSNKTKMKGETTSSHIKLSNQKVSYWRLRQNFCCWCCCCKYYYYYDYYNQ